MTDEPCRVCLSPLMKQSAKSQAKCVNCPEMPIEKLTEMTIVSEKWAEKPRDASEVLGEYLLKGWIMMGSGCPACSAPLMKSRDGNHALMI